MNNIYGRKGTENIISELMKKLHEVIDHYDDTEAKQILAQIKN